MFSTASGDRGEILPERARTNPWIQPFLVDSLGDEGESEIDFRIVEARIELVMALTPAVIWLEEKEGVKGIGSA